MSGRSSLTFSEARAILLADEALQLSYEARLDAGQTFGIEEREAWAQLVESSTARIAAYERPPFVATPYLGGNEPDFQTLALESVPGTIRAKAIRAKEQHKLDKLARGANPFLVAIDRADEPYAPQLALLFLVRASTRLREQISPPTPRQLVLEQAASTYPLPRIGSVEHTKMLIAARTRGLVNGDPPVLTDAGNFMLAPFDEAI